MHLQYETLQQNMPRKYKFRRLQHMQKARRFGQLQLGAKLLAPIKLMFFQAIKFSYWTLHKITLLTARNVIAWCC